MPFDPETRMQAINDTRKGQEPYTVELPHTVVKAIAEQHARRHSRPSKDDREILIRGRDRQQLEAVFQTSIESPADLLSKVKKLCSVSIGGVDRTFTADELARIEMQAQFHGRTREQFIKDMLDEIVGRMLEMV